MDVSLEGLIGAAEVSTASRVDAFGNLASIEEPISCPALSMRSDCGWHRSPEAWWACDGGVDVSFLG